MEKLVLTMISALILSGCGTLNLKHTPVATSLCPKGTLPSPIKEQPSKISLTGLGLDDELKAVLEAHQSDVGLMIKLQANSEALYTWVDKCSP